MRPERPDFAPVGKEILFLVENQVKKEKKVTFSLSRKEKLLMF